MRNCIAFTFNNISYTITFITQLNMIKYLRVYLPAVLLIMLLHFSASARNCSINAGADCTVFPTDAFVLTETTPLTDGLNNGSMVNRNPGNQAPVNSPMIGLAKTLTSTNLSSTGVYTLFYTFKVQNYGAIDLKNIQVADDLTAVFPSPIIFTKVSLTSSNVTAGSALAVNASFNGSTNKNLLNVATSNLKVGASGTITLTLSVTIHSTYGTFNNTATASGVTNDASATTVTDVSDNNASPNEGDATKTPLDFNTPTPVTFGLPDIQVTKTVDNPIANVGSDVTFTILVKNIGAGGGDQLVFNDLLPPGFAYVSSHSSVPAVYNSTTGNWPIGIVTPGPTRTLTIIATVLPNHAAPDYTNTATATAVDDTDPTNNSSSATVTPIPQADLSVTNTDGKTTYTPGTSNTYTVVVTNNGPSDAPGSTVTYPFPTGVTGTWTATYAGGATGTASGTGAISETASIPSGGTITYTITANVASNVTAALLTTTATVAVASGIVDPTPANNSATDNDTFAVNPPMIGLAKTITGNGLSNTGVYTLTYVFKVQNYGTVDLKNIQVTDDLTAAFPSPVTFAKVNLVSSNVTSGSALAINASFNGSTNKNLLNAASSNLKVGASGTITLTINVIPSSNYGTYYNTATATGVTNDAAALTVTDISDNNASPDEGDATKTPLDFNTPTPVNFAPPDIQVIKTVDNPTANVGSNVVFTITVKNIGAGGGAFFVFNDLLPPGFLFVSSTQPSVPYNSTTGNWPIGLVRAGTQRTLTITAKVLPNHAAPDYTNTATATATDDTNTTNDTSSATVTPIQQADLSITNTDGKATYTPGTTNTYTVTVSNNGPSDAPGSTVTYPFPTGVTGSWTATYAGGATGTASGTGAISETANIPSGGTITYTITANVASNVTAALLTTTATVAVASGIVDPTPANNSATDNDTFAPQADLAITNSDGKATYTPGTTNTYTVTVSNNGPSDVTGATVTYPFPTGVTGSWTAAYAGGATGTASGTGAISETANIPSGGSITYTITANVASNVIANPLSATATAAVATGYTDPTPANNSATDNDTFAPQADLTVTITDSVTTYTPGTTNTYTMVVTNNGPTDVTGATVTDIWPTGVNGTWTAVVTGGASVAATSGSASINQLVTMPAGATVVYTVTANVAGNLTGSLVMPGTVTAPSGVTETDASNNTESDTDTQNSKADLAVTITDGTTTYTPGTTNTYTVTVINNGPSNVTGATVTNTWPTGVSGTWTAVVTGGASVAATSGSASINQLVTMPAGSTVVYTVTANVASNATGSLTSVATVATPTGVTDSNLGNNSATDVDTQNSVADLAITNTDNKTPYVPGASNTYVIVVSNTGPSDVTGATVANPFPTGVTGSWTAVVAGGASGTLNGTGAINQTVNMPVGSTITYTVTANVASNVTGNLTSVATVTAPIGVTDPTPGNNTAQDVDTQNSIADLQVVKTVNNNTPAAGSNVTFTLVATNNGPSDATGVKVTDVLKAGYTFVSSTATAGTYNSTTGIWTIGGLANGTSNTLTITVKVNADIVVPGYDNAAVISGNETDPNTSNNTSTITTTPTPLIDLAITQTVSTNTPANGANVTFTLTVINNGPSNATGVSVADLLKAGFTFVSASPAVGTYNNTSGVWTIGSLANGATTTLTIVARVNTAGLVITDYTNNAVVSGTQTEVSLANNTSVQVVSRPPVATDDNAATSPNTPVVIDILANDIKGGANLNPATVVIIQQPAHGTLTIDPVTGRVTYMPNINYFGPDVFTYTIKDQNGAVSNMATVNIKINDQPYIGLAESVVSVVKAVNGSWDVTYLITVGNYGIPDVSNLSIKDDLTQTFNGETIHVTKVVALGSLSVNTAYNGSLGSDLLLPGNVLLRGQTQQIQVTVNVRLTNPGTKTYLNTATASGTSITGLIATDVSTDGVKPGPNTVGDVSPAVKTPVELAKPIEFIPGGFSPNGDGINDKLVIENTDARKISLEVFNRWGNLVYQSKDYKNDWGGTCTEGLHVGSQVPVGTYFYIMKFDDKDSYKGYITITR